MPSIPLCISYFFETISHKLIVFKNLFLNLSLWKYIRMFFPCTLSTFSPQCPIVFALPKCKAALYALDKEEIFGTLWDKCRDPSPVLTRGFPTLQRTSVHLVLGGKWSRKIQLWLTSADTDRSICSSHRKAKSVWFSSNNCAGFCGSYFLMVILFWFVMIKALFSLPSSDIPHKGK